MVASAPSSSRVLASSSAPSEPACAHTVDARLPDYLLPSRKRGDDAYELVARQKLVYRSVMRARCAHACQNFVSTIFSATDTAQRIGNFEADWGHSNPAPTPPVVGLCRRHAGSAARAHARLTHVLLLTLVARRAAGRWDTRTCSN